MTKGPALVTDRPQLPSPDDCVAIVRGALHDGDMDSVRLGLTALAVQDPHRAEALVETLKLGILLRERAEQGAFTAPATSSYVLRIFSFANGRPSSFDGQYLVEYDPTRAGVSPDGRPMTAHIVCSHDLAQARRFTDQAAAHAYWTTESGMPPPRDRPLTAYSVMIERIEE